MTEKSDEAVLVVVNAGSRDEAEEIGERLVAERLAASVNILPDVVSLYRWRDEPVHATEAVILVKTVRRAAERVVERVEALHSYEVPAILVLSIEGGNAAYLDWIGRQTDRATPDD